MTALVSFPLRAEVLTALCGAIDGRSVEPAECVLIDYCPFGLYFDRIHQPHCETVIRQQSQFFQTMTDGATAAVATKDQLYA